MHDPTEILFALLFALVTCLSTALLLTLCALLPLLLGLMAVSFYRLFLHPLSDVPGPKLAAISNVWYAYHARNGRVRELGKALHKRYGPVVRVGPNEVWFDSKEAFKMIYSGSGYEKSDFYRKGSGMSRLQQPIILTH
jgi:hypothetical protein